MSIGISIPSYRKVKERDVAYTVFCVEVLHGGQRHSVERRYTEFEEMHKQLKKQTKTPEFPPKKVLKWNSKVLEHRRLGLQAYLQGLLEIGSIPQVLLDFLGIYDLGNVMDNEGESDGPKTTHQPLVAFDKKAFLQDTCTSSLPDIITDGVISGLYSRYDEELPR